MSSKVLGFIAMNLQKGMMVTVLDGIFQKTHNRGSLGHVPQIEMYCSSKIYRFLLTIIF